MAHLAQLIPAGWQSPSNGGVSVNLGAKGVVEFELVASGAKWGKGPKTDIHSSEKARVDSPAWRLVSALATLVTPDGNTPAVDGYFEKVRPLTAREKEICARIGPALRERGFLLVGIDVIGDYMTEINVTSPTGLREVKRFGGADIASLFWDAVERKRA